MQSDGTRGHQSLGWDITTWHNYDAYGDIFDIGSNGEGPTFDLPAYSGIRRGYGVPFMITKWNPGLEYGDTFRANHISAQFASFYRQRKFLDIRSVMYWVLNSGSATYGIMINGVPLTP